MTDRAPGAVSEVNSMPSPQAAGEDLGIADVLVSPIHRGLERRWADQSGALAAICHYALVPPGKLFRPNLVLESALAVGGTTSSVLPAAIGAECGHVASLIHDDIIDGDDLRRGRPSVPSAYGVAHAIVAGDALIFDLFACLAECRNAGVPDDRVVSALEVLAQAGLDLCRGQSIEMELQRSQDVDLDVYLVMISLKTAALFQGACMCGAILGGGTPDLVDAMCEYGQHLGMSFQILDDLLPFISDTGLMGKPQLSDVRNGRYTLPIILAYQAGGPADREFIRSALSGRTDPAGTLADLVELLDRTGAIDAAREAALQHATQASEALAVIPAGPSRDRLAALAELAIARNR
jgi:geranylgeranyl pyrophosphate synthase